MKIIGTLIVSIILAFGVIGCQQKTAEETAQKGKSAIMGEKIAEHQETAKMKAEEMGEEMSEEAEEMGEMAEEMAEEAEEMTEEMTEEMHE